MYYSPSIVDLEVSIIFIVGMSSADFHVTLAIENIREYYGEPIIFGIGFVDYVACLCIISILNGKKQDFANIPVQRVAY